MKIHFTKPAILLATAWFLSFNVYAQAADENISNKEKKAVIEAVSQQLEDNYVFPEIAKTMADQLKKSLSKGNYEKISNAIEFRDALTKDLVAVSKDKHIRVIFDPKGIADQQQAVTPEAEQQLMDQQVARRRLGNFGFNEVKILDGNIGYLDLRSFQPPSFAGDTAVAAMNFLANSDAIIIDLRQNGGGSPQMIQLISSYLFGEEPVHLNSFYSRPSDSHSQTWTLPHVLGNRYPDVPVIATDRFQVWVPTGRAINPITNTNWEGTGVSPHIAVKQALAFDTAYIKAKPHKLYILGLKMA
ncbi:MAG: hypothetical protein ACJAX5_002869 [Patiriisocius sp.]|jgi:hypothetical protein